MRNATRRTVVVLALPALLAAATATASADERQELGARLGAQIGVGDVTPGGLRVGGVFLYRMTESTWSDSGASFTFGSGAADCYLTRDPADTVACEHGLADGFSFELATGARWLPPIGGDDFEPYVRGGLALALARFAEDELTGVALPLWIGAGARFRVADRVTVGGEALLEAGPAIFGRGLSYEPWVALVVQFGVEFQL